MPFTRKNRISFSFSAVRLLPAVTASFLSFQYSSEARTPFSPLSRVWLFARDTRLNPASRKASPTSLGELNMG